MDVNVFDITIISLGGMGLFLLGMIVMTDALKVLAGETMRKTLMRFTRTPLSGAITGAATTAVLQSSSATTMAAVGFVSAGLMGFNEALGIVFGANIGTTITGWLVVFTGFKFKLSAILMPLVLVGASMRLFSNGRMAVAGLALAGFGLIFAGIDTMQHGMANLQQVVTPDVFPQGTFFGRLQLFLIGFAITFVTQSSSAGVAVALTALYSGAIEFEQAAAIVIGMDVGTTVKTAIVALGSSTDSKRTGISHVVYNLFTAVGALILLSPFIWFFNWAVPGFIESNSEIALVAFHSFFNTIGVIAILPFTRQFTNLMEYIVREKVSLYTRGLDKALLKDSALAITSSMTAVNRILFDLLQHVTYLLGRDDESRRADLQELKEAIDKTREYVDSIELHDHSGESWNRLLALIHVLDHMRRLHERCDEDAVRARYAIHHENLKPYAEMLAGCIEQIIDDVGNENLQHMADIAKQSADEISALSDTFRGDIISVVADGGLNVKEATNYLEAIRWLVRVSVHIDRISNHMLVLVGQQPEDSGNE